VISQKERPTTVEQFLDGARCRQGVIFYAGQKWTCARIKSYGTFKETLGGKKVSARRIKTIRLTRVSGVVGDVQHFFADVPASQPVVIVEPVAAVTA
jgi:hypothetical protein